MTWLSEYEQLYHYIVSRDQLIASHPYMSSCATIIFLVDHLRAIYLFSLINKHLVKNPGIRVAVPP